MGSSSGRFICSLSSACIVFMKKSFLVFIFVLIFIKINSNTHIKVK